MAIHTVRIIKGGRTLLRKQVSEGLGRDAVVIQAQADVTYLLSDPLNNTGPSKISAKRVGNSLHLALGKGTPDVPDLIIEGYFNYPAAPVAGVLAEGGQAVYDLGALTSPSTTLAGISDSPALDNTVVQANQPSQGWGNTGLVVGAVAGAVALGGGGGSGGGSPATTDAAATALVKVVAFATDGTLPAPTATDYADIGVKGLNSFNLSAINNAVDTLPVGSVNTRDGLQLVADAYNKILLEANSSAADATPGNNPLVSDYAAIGANIGSAANSLPALSLLNGVIGNLTSIAVDTVAEINALAAVVDKIMQSAAGTPAALTVADFALLGLPTSGAGAVTLVNLAAVNNAIAFSGGPTKVDTYAELGNLVTSVATIVSYADDSSQAVPSLAQYAAANITGVTATNLGAINSAVEANAISGVDTQVELQGLVDTYNLILAEANGSAADATPSINPTAAQFALIGANIGSAATNAVNLSLLVDAIAGLPNTAVDTIVEINELAAAANAVMTGAAGSTAPTLAQLSALGITGVTVNNILAVQNAIAVVADSGLQVDTVAELQTVVSAAANAAASGQTLIQNYAASNLGIAPNAADFTNMGVTGVGSDNLSAINSAVDALSSGGVDTPYKVQTMVDAYSRILSEANGTSADATPGVNPTANDYAAIGASLGLASGGIASGTDLASNALALLNDAVANLTAAAIDTVAELNAKGVATDKVMSLARLTNGSSIPMDSLSMADLTLLGINTAMADTTAEVNAILQAIINSSDSGSAVNTIQALQALVNSQVS